MEKYELIMIINRLLMLKDKDDMIISIKAVLETELAGSIFGNKSADKHLIFQRLFKR